MNTIMIALIEVSKIASIIDLDQAILFYIQTNFHFPVLDEIMIFFTTVGNFGLIWILLALLLILKKETRYIGVLTLAALLLGIILGEGILKNIIQRPRPFTDFPSVQLLINQPSTYAFPSGHTMSSFAAAYVLSKYMNKYSLIIWIVAVTIAFSRLYLSVHYFSDIIGGIALGLICGKIVCEIYERKVKKELS
jgi:undecaprenyl-diphosphatase